MPLIGTIIHSTRGKRADDTLAKARTGNETWHFTIDRDGLIYQHVSLNCTAQHAGTGILETVGVRSTQLNTQTIGIELVNLGGVVQEQTANATNWRIWNAPKGDKPAELGNVVKPHVELHKAGPQLEVGNSKYDAYWEEFPPEQTRGLNRLLAALESSSWHAAIQTIVSHERVARPQGRKIDPGPLFPAEALEYDYLP